MMFALVVCGSYAQNTPPYAASAKTWAFGDQTWSDAIQIPACNKESFTKSDNEPHCRSYTEGGNTWYYYNWEYVSRNVATMCPAPWRVPTNEDFDTLRKNTRKGLSNGWGYGGRANANAMENVSLYGYYWSSTDKSSLRAIYIYYGKDGMGMYVGPIQKYYGHQVRCVK